MSNLTYKTADQLPIMEEVTDNTYVLVEESGQIKRVSGSNLGGGIKTAMITCNIVNEVFECTNMTFEEAYQAMTTGESIDCIATLIVNDLASASHPVLVCDGTEPTIVIKIDAGLMIEPGSKQSNISLLAWTSSGIDEYRPEG